jgi:hypothetical protein
LSVASHMSAKKKALASAAITLILLITTAYCLTADYAVANFFLPPAYITIRSDGTVEPQNSSISRNGNVYSLTANLSLKCVRIQCSNIVLDGAGHIINGTVPSSHSLAGWLSDGNGLILQNVTNVTVKDLEILGFDAFDVSILNCSSCIIQRVKANTFYLENSHLNTIKESKIAGNVHNAQDAIIMRLSNSNEFYRNNITCVILEDCNSNIFFENNFENMTGAGKVYPPIGPNAIFGGSENNLWDNGSVGNYWSDYSIKYPNASEIGNTGIGDTPYTINAENVDNYPLMYALDNTAPSIKVLSPASGTFNASSIQLSFTVDEPASLITYSLDGKANITITENVTLTGLANGVHDLTIYAMDKAGNVGPSETISFEVDAPVPLSTLLVVAASGAAITGVAVLLYYYKKRKR